jgi:hypothetical protein
VALADNLISYWPLDEASGSALDAHGSNDLAETSGTIGTAAGKVGNARDFELGDTEYFSIADNTDLSTGDIDFSISGWFFKESAPGDHVIAGKFGTTGNQREYRVFATTSNLTFAVSSDGTLGAVVSVNASAAVEGQWYFFACGHNASTNEIWISVDAATPVTASHSAGVFNGTAAFALGARVATDGDYFDGLIDEVGFWKRDIRADLAELYNSGSGRDYDYITGGAASSVSATLATMEIAGFDASVSVGTSISATLGSIEIAGFPASVSVGTNIDSTTASLQITPLAADVTVESTTTINATTATIEITPIPASVSVGVDVHATMATAEIAGFNSSVSVGTTINSSLATIEATGFSASVSSTTTISANVATVEVTGLDASVSIESFSAVVDTRANARAFDTRANARQFDTRANTR